MDITENSIVLRTGKFRENDVWVKLLTANHGIITVFAFGASRSRRRFTGCLDSYNHILSRVSSSKNGQFLNLQEASLLGSFSHIRADWKKQGFVANCIRFLEALGVNPFDAEKVFTLTKALFHYIDETKDVHPMIPILYRYRMATEYGYGLDVSKCFQCSKELGKERTQNTSTQNKAYFLVSEGYFVCQACKPQGMMALYASKECLDFLNFIQEFSPEHWGTYTLNSETWREIGRIIDALVRYHLGIEWTEGRFKRT